MTDFPENLTGSSLVASTDLYADIFCRTVIYIASHDRQSATGLVLNRPTKFLATRFFPEIKQSLPVYWGGPVKLDTLFFLHRVPGLIPGGWQVAGNIRWGGDFSAVKELLAHGWIDGKDIRFFIGYSGWGAGQLEGELKEKSWLLQPPGIDPFEKTAGNLWEECLCGLPDMGALILSPKDEEELPN